jgi:hypothetical protein
MATLDSYEARITMARMRYRQACEDLPNLPDPNRAAAEAIAFTTLQSVQQDAMRELAASEFASLLELREELSERLGRRAAPPGAWPAR